MRWNLATILLRNFTVDVMNRAISSQKFHLLYLAISCPRLLTLPSYRRRIHSLAKGGLGLCHSPTHHRMAHSSAKGAQGLGHSPSHRLTAWKPSTGAPGRAHFTFRYQRLREYLNT
jgi:hypothetical protein